METIQPDEGRAQKPKILIPYIPQATTHTRRQLLSLQRLKGPGTNTRREQQVLGIVLAMVMMLTACAPAQLPLPEPMPTQPAATKPAPTEGQPTPSVDTSELRIIQPLMENWRFVQDDNLSDKEALESTGERWQTVNLPHTWNAEDAASLQAENYERGIGWYRLTFDTPAEGARHWLEFGAASLVADVWLNGEYLGQHKGGFAIFRFDITDALAETGENVLLVKVTNDAPGNDNDLTAIAPLGGDFNVSGGLYRYVSLVSTADPVHFALGNMGGPGVYATTVSVDDGDATVNVEARVRSDSDEAGDYLVRLTLLDQDGAVAATAEQAVRLEARGQSDVVVTLNVADAHLWNGRADPYLYQLMAELLRADSTPVDRLVQRYGIREMRFDPNEGFFLNGEHMRMNGVAMHQDYLGKAWAQSEEDWDTSFDLIMEIGANAVRFGHYPFPQYALDKADELGLVVWSETPLGLRTHVRQCATTPPTDEYVENAKQQLEEMIRQQYNHPSVGMWSIGNETSAGQQSCDPPYDDLTPLLRELHALAKQIDPGRHTTYAEFGHPLDPAVRVGPWATEGITDLFATNRYFLWYTQGIEGFGEILDGLHALTPDQPLGVSEYGAGAAISHHTDNPLGGYPDIRSSPDGETSYQPEEYAAYVHEQDYRVLEERPYLWGTFVWNMFDFGSAHRNEGDVLGVNTKGLVTFDRQTRKDPFFFYKANWSTEPTTYIVGRRYTDRAYVVNDIKVYSNADSVELSVNGEVIGTMTADQCELKTCVFPGIQLSLGDNTITAVGDHAGQTVRDEVTWTLQSEDVNIAAGAVATGFISPEGDRFGSDNFFKGGIFDDPGDPPTPNDLTAEASDISELYEHFRQGEFSYEIPVKNGTYNVTLGFIEPFEETQEGERVFDVIANGETVIDDLDILDEVGEPRTVLTEDFTAEVTDGLLRLEFTPSEGDAVVSTISVRNSASVRNNLGALAGAADREYLVQVLTTIARPVLTALAEGRLHESLPVRDWEGRRTLFSPYEAFARTLAGIAPWLELGPDDTPEGQLRAEFIELSRQALINATDPDSPDFMTFDESDGDQPLVESAYLASALMSAPEQLYEPLTDEQKENVLDALRTSSREIVLDHNNNWWLFPAMIEAALWELGADYEIQPIEEGVEKMAGWYLGDGIYGDGPDFHWDYYNSYVIHPMLLQVLRVAEGHGHSIEAQSLELATVRAQRYAEILERQISPEGTFPVMGRSSAYRFAAFYHLAYMALNHDLPDEVKPGAARSGITAIVRNMFEAPGTLDEEGWLQLGAVGHQPGLEESYNSTGSLYACLTGLVHLGLPADDPFWTGPDADWTQKQIWSGEDVPRDHALESGLD